MFKASIVAIFFWLFAYGAFAQETPDQHCDRMKAKAAQEACYVQLVQERKEALEEYAEAITDSSRIPANVKAEVLKDYQSFMRNIQYTCPDKGCIAAAMLEQIKDMYKETARFTTAR